MKHCQWCDTQFTPNTSYQIYCSSLCREEATKEKIALRYEKTRRERRKNRDRRCKLCDTALSIYNDEKTCEQCLIDPKEVNRREMIEKIIDGAEEGMKKSFKRKNVDIDRMISDFKWYKKTAEKYKRILKKMDKPE